MKDNTTDVLGELREAYEEIAKTQDMPEGVTVEEWCWKSDRLIRNYLDSLQQPCPKCGDTGWVKTNDRMESTLDTCDCGAGE